MSLPNTSEWGDIPSSSELFGNEFFGDELMEMYANGGDDDDHENVISSLLGESHHPSVVTDPTPVKLEVGVVEGGAALSHGQDAHDVDKHPGMLIAMNAAAMDNGLGALGSSVEFSSPVSVVDHSSAVFYAPVTTMPSVPLAAAPPVAAPAAAAAPAPRAPAPAPVFAAQTVKRPSNTTESAANKKRRGGGKAPATSSTGPPAPPKGTRAGAPLRQGARPPPVAPAPGVPPRHMVPGVQPVRKGGGIPHQIVPRPPMVPSTVVSTARVMPPGSSSGMIPKTAVPNGAKHGDPGLKRAPTEADFKDVAQAAVTSLIQNASSGVNGVPAVKGPVPPMAKPPTTKPTEKIDTSTAHINALTSQNWVNACNPVPAPVESSGNTGDKAARNARRASLSQEERAKQNRDRNREHARNTRLRKKAYVEELKRTLTEIVAQRDAAELEKRHNAQREREQREVRFRVMEEFLKLRGRNELNAARWVAILEDGFTCTLPKTPYRQMVEGEKTNEQSTNSPVSISELEQVLRGASAAMEDSQYLSNFLQLIGGGANPQHLVQVVFRCERSRFFMDGNVTFMDFTASTAGIVNKGVPNEIVFRGSMRASFSPASNKLISVDIMFDTGAITTQLERLGVNTTADAAAAAAAHEADALLDSLQMPHFAENENGDGNEPPSVSSDESSN